MNSLPLPEIHHSTTLAELAFPNLAGKAHAMIIAAHCPNDSKGKIGLESVRTATMLDDMKAVQVGDVNATRDVHVMERILHGRATY